METFLGEVRNIKDPDRQGRVQVRIYGLHDDTANIKDENLPWALPVLPITSASTAKTGIIPSGMEKGSRVVGTWLDMETKKYPIIFGTYYRAYKPSNQFDNTGGQEGNDQASKGIDFPHNPGTEGKSLGKTPNNTAVGGKALDTEADEYNKARYAENGDGPDGIDEARKRFAPKADDGTIAGAPFGLDLPAALKMVDPLGTAQSLAQMFSALGLVASLMSMNSKSGQSSGIKTTVTEALTGALCLLSNRQGYDAVITTFTKCLSGGGVDKINADYKPIIKEALGKLIYNATEGGTTNFTEYSKPDVIYHTTTDPVPLPIVNSGPDTYVQQYYDPATDPWKGFIEWKGPKGDLEYTVRNPTDHPFSSPMEHIYSMAEDHLAKELEPYVIKRLITPEKLNAILKDNLIITQNNGLEKTAGKGSASNPMAMIAILGALGTLINLTQSLHLPLSALNTGRVALSLGLFSKNMAIIKTMKAASLPAFGFPGIGALGALGGLSSIAGGAFSNIAGIATDIVGDTVGNVLGDVLGQELGDIAGDVAAAVTEGAITYAAVKNLGGSLNNTALLTNIILKSL